MSCALIGGDRDGNLAQFRARAEELGVGARFLGEVPKEEVNSYVSRSRIGVIVSEKDAAPQAILEYLAADVPVLVNSQLRAGSRYVNSSSREVLAPERLHEGISRILDNPAAYEPRAEYLARFSRDRVIERFLAVLASTGLKLPLTAAD